MSDQSLQSRFSKKRLLIALVIFLPVAAIAIKDFQAKKSRSAQSLSATREQVSFDDAESGIEDSKPLNFNNQVYNGPPLWGNPKHGFPRNILDKIESYFCKGYQNSSFCSWEPEHPFVEVCGDDPACLKYPVNSQERTIAESYNFKALAKPDVNQ
jgi:hypothetical protein